MGGLGALEWKAVASWAAIMVGLRVRVEAMGLMEDKAWLLSSWASLSTQESEIIDFFLGHPSRVKT